GLARTLSGPLFFLSLMILRTKLNISTHPCHPSNIGFIAENSSFYALLHAGPPSQVHNCTEPSSQVQVLHTELQNKKHGEIHTGPPLQILVLHTELQDEKHNGIDEVLMNSSTSEWK